MSGIDLYFVHGTWSDGRVFSDETSPFFGALSQALGPDLQVQRFRWSGGNSVRAREQAALSFASNLQARAVAAPGRGRIVLCHSHGGSVVMGALARAEQPLPIDALVTIGTPYLYVDRFESVEPNAVAPLRPGVVAGLLVVVAVLAGLTANGMLQAPVRALSAMVAAHPWAIGSGFLGLVLAGGFIGALREMVRGTDLERQRLDIVRPPDDAVERLRWRCRLPDAERVPTLLVKVPGDEAHGALASAQFMSWLLRTLYAAPLRLAGRMRRAVRGDDDFDDRPWAALAHTIFLDLPLALFELALRVALSVPVVLVASLLSIPFGSDFVRSAGVLVLSVADTPPGDWRIVSMPPLDLRAYRREHLDRFLEADVDYLHDEFDELEADLQRRYEYATRGTPHGRAYGDPRVAAVLARWLHDRVPALFAESSLSRP